MHILCPQIDHYSDQLPAVKVDELNVFYMIDKYVDKVSCAQLLSLVPVHVPVFISLFEILFLHGIVFPHEFDIYNVTLK